MLIMTEEQMKYPDWASKAIIEQEILPMVQEAQAATEKKSKVRLDYVFPDLSTKLLATR